MSLDPDDPRKASEQIAAVLRAEIKTGKVAPGEKLASQHELSTRFGVARETVKRALDLLRADRLIVTRQGSGTFVRAKTEPPVGLRPHIERAFESTHVRIDFAGFSGETLYNSIQEALDKVRAGRLTPETIHVRMLVADTSGPLMLPRRVEENDAAIDIQQRSARITERSIYAVREAVQELADLELVKQATTEVRVHNGIPMFKLFIINDEDVYFGFYPVVERTISINGEQTAIYDVMGKDAVMFPFTVSDEEETSEDSLYVEEARKWFDSVWTTIAHKYEA